MAASRRDSTSVRDTLRALAQTDVPRVRTVEHIYFVVAFQTSPASGLSGRVSPSHSEASSGVSKVLTLIPRFRATVSPNLRGSRRGSWITNANCGSLGIRDLATRLIV